MKNFFELLTETRAESGKGSAAGRSSIHTHSKKSHTKSSKARVKVYKSITDALKRGYMGQIFSTVGSDRLYVITKAKWGKDDEQIINGRSAKGFTPGTIPAKFDDVKKYSVRTMVRHSGSGEKSFKGDKYWASGKAPKD
jgi:hypothetical protein